MNQERIEFLSEQHTDYVLAIFADDAVKILIGIVLLLSAFVVMRWITKHRKK